MMTVVAASALAANLLVSDEKSFFHMPGAEEFRIQRISRIEHSDDWPFTVDEGYLSCAYVMGTKAVYFTEMPEDNEPDATVRVMIVSTNPFEIALGNMIADGLLRKSTDFPELIRQIAPFQSIGERLCDQPPGEIIGPGEL